MQLSPGEHIIHQSRDAYGDLVVTDTEIYRHLYFGSISKQSSLLLQQPDMLVLRYTQAMAISVLFNSRPQRILLLGLGGGSLAKFLLNACPQATIDAVELRQSVIRLAHGYFGVPEDHPRLQIHCQDGLEFVRRLDATGYDLILLDVYDRQGPVNEFLQWDFLQNCRQQLRPGGVLCANLWNRQIDDFRQRYREFQAVFRKQTLRYVLDKQNGNALVFAFDKRPDLRQLETPAAMLKRQWQVDAPVHLAAIRGQNAGE
ncbi:MAG: methyltransferase [Gammaproteobacteria bacterium]|nr:methyltransferase [Gammaproteobacteria bacterium]